MRGITGDTFFKGRVEHKPLLTLCLVSTCHKVSSFGWSGAIGHRHNTTEPVNHGPRALKWQQSKPLPFLSYFFQDFVTIMEN